MDALLLDVRQGARVLWNSKGLTLVAALSLAVGIGANAAMFSIVNSMLLRPRPIADPGRIIELYVGDRQIPYQTTSWPSFLDLRERNGVLEDLAAYSVGWQFRLGGPDDVEQVWGEVVSGNYFDVLGVGATRGRTFLSEEDRVPGRDPVVVIGYGLWQRRFHGDPGLIGSTVMLNNRSFTVVGVAAARYTGMVAGWASEVWVPAMATPLLDPVRVDRGLLTRHSRWVTMVGRLKEGVPIEQARARFAVLTREMQAAYPDEWMRGNGDAVRESFISVLSESATRVHPAMRAPAYAVAALLFIVIDLVLFIACMNLAGMLFAKAVTRRSEIAVRMALGAGRGRIVRQLLTESLLLAVISAGAGMLMAVWAVDAVLTFMPPLPEGIRIAADIRMDWRVLAYTLAFTTLTGLLFGLAPALHSAKTALSTVMKDDAGTAGVRASRSRMVLLVAQVAVSSLLLIGAGLVLRSLENVRPTRLGYDSDRIVVAPLDLDESTYDRPGSQLFYENVSDAVAAIPGVRGVSLVDGMPGGFMSRTRRGIEIEGYRPGADEDMEIDAAIVGPSYFSGMLVPFVAGRDFSRADRDGATCATIVNVAFATQYFGGASAALGRHLLRRDHEIADRKEACEVVGVIRDDRWQSLQEAPRPFFAMPVLQSEQHRMTMLVHTAAEPRAFIPAVREAVRRLDRDMPVTDVRTLDESFSSISFPFRLLGLVIGACGVLALLLATVAVYGAVSYSVAQRMREVGIRMALGADHADIIRLVVGQTMRLVGGGLMLGLVLAAALTRVLASLPMDTPLLFGVGATDAATFAIVTVLLGAAGLLASYMPATLATKADPVTTLRNS